MMNLDDDPFAPQEEVKEVLKLEPAIPESIFDYGQHRQKRNTMLVNPHHSNMKEINP